MSLLVASAATISVAIGGRADIPGLYNLTMDPYEKYDMVFNGAAPSRVLTSSPGKLLGHNRF
jgi:hypothetical protein